MIDPPLQTVIALALALLFASAGLYKLTQTARFSAQLAEYRLLPATLVSSAARLLGAGEMLLAAALLIPMSRAYAGLAAVGLLAAYAAAIAINLLRGRSYIDCGCGDTPQMLSAWLLLRNGMLAAGAGLLVLPSAPYEFAWLDLAVYVPVFVMLCLVYLLAEQLLENASILKEWSQLRD